MTADYEKFILDTDKEYKKFPKDDFVYNHKGELLYFYTYNPADVPVFQWNPLFDFDAIRENNDSYGIIWNDTHGHTNYNMKGTDCDGVPTFSHNTADYIGTHYKDINEFEPLTVETVLKWYGWILWQLNNVVLKK